MNWDNYDKWRLASPYDDQIEVEIFETRKYKYYSLNENLINKFDDQIEAFERKAQELEICPEDVAEELAEELGLYNDETELIIEHEQMEQDAKEYAMQCRYDEMRGK